LEHVAVAPGERLGAIQGAVGAFILSTVTN